MTLVATVAAGVNDREIGRIVQMGIENSLVRGVNFQPVAFFGRCGDMSREYRMYMRATRNGGKYRAFWRWGG
jgi:uncharacterized radical SAM superfamily Fe-S cluster-containing enzyme